MTLKEDMLDDIASVFLDTDEFADAGVWCNRYSEEKIINGIFDDEYEQVNPATGMIETTAPQFQVATSDIDGMLRGETVTIGGITYSVIRIQPDGTGMTTLILSKDPP